MVSRGRLAFVGSLAIAGLILVGAPSCGSGFLDGLSGGARDAGTEASVVDAPVVDARACQPFHPPPKPDIVDSEEPSPVVVAMDAVRVDDANNVDASVPATHGLDLDDMCTCPEPETCTPPPDAGKKACDGDGGTDNSLGRMFSYLGSIFADEFGPDFATRRIRKGAYGAMFSIGGWNHKPDDPKVAVAVFLSQGLDDRFDAGPKNEPNLDGTDVWTIDPASVSNGDENIGADCSVDITKCFAVHISNDAYVANGYLVAKMDIPLAISTTSGRIVLDFEDVTLMAKLEKDGSVFRMKGEFVGRWPVTKVLESLARVPVNDQPLCDQQGFFEVARNEVCSNVDVMADKTQDHQGKRCDAVSAAISFSAVSAKLGRIFRPAEPPPVCTQFVADCPP